MSSLDRLGKARYISTLDLTKGYWQVPLSQSSREKTAFSTPQWPLALPGATLRPARAPATFQRMMDILLRPHQAYAALTWMMSSYTQSVGRTHLERLRRVVDGAPTGWPHCHPKNCHLGLTEAKVPGVQDWKRAHHAPGKEG